MKKVNTSRKFQEREGRCGPGEEERETERERERFVLARVERERRDRTIEKRGEREGDSDSRFERFWV